ncbi:MAG: hypothetical protein ACPGLY_07735 [Rubripirellula sp.]
MINKPFDRRRLLRGTGALISLTALESIGFRRFASAAAVAAPPTRMIFLGFGFGVSKETWLITHRNEPDVRPLFDLTLNLRPKEDLYDLRCDTDQLDNVDNDDDNAKIRSELSSRLVSVLEATDDPRLTNAFDQPPYVDNQRGLQ